LLSFCLFLGIEKQASVLLTRGEWGELGREIRKYEYLSIRR
jgi:hypothetical protein